MSEVNETSSEAMNGCELHARTSPTIKLDQHLEKLNKAEEGGDTFDGSHIVANDILNEILETAMDLATRDPDEDETSCKAPGADIRNIIEGLNKINVEKVAREKQTDENITEEMKRLLGEILSQPGDSAKRDGIGDQQPVSNTNEREEICQRNENRVEKKSRITDLVMNSKKALANLLSEEQRKKQNEWEESNEHVIQVIELQEGQSEMVATTPGDIDPANIPLPDEEDDTDLITKPEDEDTMDYVDLNLAHQSKIGEGDNEQTQSIEKSSKTKDLMGNEEKPKKKKRWLCTFHKFFHFKRNKNKRSMDATSEQPAN